MGDFYEIQQRCLKEGRLWEDEDFPASWRSLRLREDSYISGIVWKRPKEIVENPKYIVKNAAYYDIYQGDLGNCWVIASAISLAACKPRLLDRVAFFDQSFDEGKYAGIFHFRFWQYGNWVEVLIDDRLPTVGGKLVFARNRQEPNEFWGPLLEKAYAKLNGSYDALIAGVITDALVDLTGGITERIDLMKTAYKPDDIAKILREGIRTNTVVGGAIWQKENRPQEWERDDGLLEGHAYGIMRAEQVTVRGRKVDLLHVRNPHGRGEWSGAWSDGSPEWKQLSSEDRSRIPHVNKNDGDFWMSVEDFVKCFDELQMCHLSPDGMTNQLAEEEGKVAWKITEFWGEWIRGLTDGGSSSSFTSRRFWKNPQFKTNLESAVGSSTTMVVSLMRKISRPESISSKIAIGFDVFKLREGRQPEKINADNYHVFYPRLVKTSGSFTMEREVTLTYDMEPGTYVIVPFTRLPGQEAEFYLRVFAEISPDIEPVISPVGPINGNFEVETDSIGRLFEKYSHQGIVDSFGLRDLLSQLMEEEYGNNQGVTLETTRSLISYVDEKMSGWMDVDKVRVGWDMLKLCMRGFKNFDKDNSGTIDISELNEVYTRIGFSVNAMVLKAVVRRYGNQKGEMMRDDFLQSFFRMLTLHKKFKNQERNGKVTLDLNEWLQEALYA